jgi:hypothetical protein
MSESNVLDETGSMDALVSERRREDRLRLNIPGEITGIDSAGRLFADLVTIEDVTEFGCRIETHVHLEPGAVVAIKPLGPGQKSLPDRRTQLFEVVWSAPREGCWGVGAKKLQGEKLAKLRLSLANYSRKYRSPR